jgi:DNA primase
MAGRIPKQFIEELVGRADIVELIGTRVPLKKAGREYKACCPFHEEKSPSFYVNPVKQFYHCFGCGQHGTALGFLMNYDRLSFPEAVEELAAKLGIEVPRESGGAPAPQAASDDLYLLMQKVAQFFNAELAKNARAQEYVARRGLDASALERFQIGYAKDSWNEVLKRFGTNEEACTRLLQTGLIVEREQASTQRGSAADNRYYDRFRDRLMFPIRDARGRTIGFGGRIIDQGEPKYLNSPETALFHKGRELYGLFEVRQNRAPLKRLLVVEGYMDVVRLHQAGVAWSVATLGTATTPEHLARAFRLVTEIVFAFDGDRAGRAAAWRALNNALPEARAGREMRFLFLPEGEDPDSLVGAEGAAAFEGRLVDALPLSEYLVAHLLQEADVRHADGKGRFVALAKPLVEKVPAGPYRELLLDRLAQAIDVSAARFNQIVGELANPAPPANSGPIVAAALRNPVQRGGTRAAGRGPLLRQAVQCVLHFPAIANQVTGAVLEQLAGLEEPGMPILVELLTQLREQPATSTAQLLERWRDRAEYERLARLALEESIIPDARVAAGELLTAIGRLVVQGGAGQRLDALLDKARGGPLSEAEKQELQALMSARNDRRASS